jgi:hypothetical protein
VGGERAGVNYLNSRVESGIGISIGLLLIYMNGVAVGYGIESWSYYWSGVIQIRVIGISFVGQLPIRVSLWIFDFPVLLF